MNEKRKFTERNLYTDLNHDISARDNKTTSIWRHYYLGIPEDLLQRQMVLHPEREKDQDFARTLAQELAVVAPSAQ
jgi:hypothetical protein